MTTYLVTGASRGLGLEFVRQLRARGDTVIGTVRDRKSGADAAALGAELLIADVASSKAIEGLPQQVGGRAIDVLINNAGVNSEGKRLEELEVGDLERVFAVNTFAPVMVTKALLPSLRA